MEVGVWGSGGTFGVEIKLFASHKWRSFSSFRFQCEMYLQFECVEKDEFFGVLIAYIPSV